MWLSKTQLQQQQQNIRKNKVKQHSHEKLLKLIFVRPEMLAVVRICLKHKSEILIMAINNIALSLLFDPILAPART